jgi:hypothetical protein
MTPKTQPGEVQKFLSTLTPSGWTWIGRTAILRVPGRGTFQLDIWNDGHGGHVSGLNGAFTADAGTQEKITFRFADHLTVDPSGRTDHHTIEVIEHCGWHWYVTKPLTLKPFHNAIQLWVEIMCSSKPLPRAKGAAPKTVGGAS